MTKSQYLEYSEAHKKVEIISTRPSILGFLRKYLLCMTPMFALLIYYLITPLFGYLANTVFTPVAGFVNFVMSAMNIPQDVVNSIAGFVSFLLILFIFLLVSWVLRSTEASGAIGLALIMPLILAVVEVWSSQPVTADTLKLAASVMMAYRDNFLTGVFLAVAILLIRTEIYRRSIRYTITDTGVSISGGIWRKQEQTMPYNQIGRVVLEQSLFGRLLNYGTVIPVGVAEWGAEYYTREVGTEVEGDRISAEVSYARTLKEVSRDPLKCLYGVRKPNEIKTIIEKMITAPFRAEIDQVEYLRKIYEKMDSGD